MRPRWSRLSLLLLSIGNASGRERRRRESQNRRPDGIVFFVRFWLLKQDTFPVFIRLVDLKPGFLSVCKAIYGLLFFVLPKRPRKPLALNLVISFAVRTAVLL